MLVALVSLRRFAPLIAALALMASPAAGQLVDVPPFTAIDGTGTNRFGNYRMAAGGDSGALVVTNANPYNTWLLKHRENCLVAENSPTALAEALEEGLTNQALREQLTGNASRLIAERYSNWDGQMEKIYRYVVDNC